MDRIKRLSGELLEKYPDKFTGDFEENKTTMKDLATIRSKVLRNRIAGYITSTIRKEKEINERTQNQEAEEEAEEDEG
ncbi:MAG: 30S ribosomal protein S17e [Nitrososphaeraceae archaeon]